MNTQETIAQTLREEGVDTVFAYPVNPIIDACARNDIRTVIVRQERTGLHMADAVSRVSSGDRIGVFLMQHGPGAESGFGGIAQAFSESVPIFVIVGGYSRALAHHFPNFNATMNYQHVSKHVEPLTDPDQLAGLLRRTLSRLKHGRPGPVVVEIPADTFRSEASDQPVNYRPTPRARSAPDPNDVQRAVDLLQSADAPVIYAGHGIHYAKAWPELRQFAEAMDIPVMTTLAGKSAFPEDHPLSLGTAGRTYTSAVGHFLSRSDVVFGVGCSFATTLYGVAISSDKTVIHATVDPDALQSDVRAEVGLLGDARLTLQAMLDCVTDVPRTRPEAHGRITAEIKRVKDAWLDDWREHLTSGEVPINPYRIIAELERRVDKARTIITHDAGSARDMLGPFWTSTKPLSYLGWGKSTQLGYGLGLALGAKLMHPDRLCINIWGDAAIGFTGMDLETAVRERLPILSILLNNASMAQVGLKTAHAQFGSANISGHYASVAEALGCYAERITDPTQIAAALDRGIEATERGQPALLEFMTSRDRRYSTPSAIS